MSKGMAKLGSVGPLPMFSDDIMPEPSDPGSHASNWDAIDARI